MCTEGLMHGLLGTKRSQSNRRFPYGYLVMTYLKSCPLPGDAAHLTSQSHCTQSHVQEGTSWGRHTARPSGSDHFLKLTGGVYKARVHIHRGVLIRDYLQFHLHVIELQMTIRTRCVFEIRLHFRACCLLDAPL